MVIGGGRSAGHTGRGARPEDPRDGLPFGDRHHGETRTKGIGISKPETDS